MSRDYAGNPIDPLDDLIDGGDRISDETAQEMEDMGWFDRRAEASQAIDDHENRVYAPDEFLDQQFEDRISGGNECDEG